MSEFQYPEGAGQPSQPVPATDGAYDAAMAAAAGNPAATEPNLLRGALFGLGGALVGALVYSAVTILAEVEVLYLGIGIGFLAAIGVAVGARVPSILTRLIAVAMTAVGALVSVFVVMAGFAAKQLEVSIFEVFQYLDYGLALQYYFESFFEYLVFGIALIVAFVYSNRFARDVHPRFDN